MSEKRIVKLENLIDQLDRRLRILEKDKNEEEELIAAAFDPPPANRKTYSRLEVESYGKIHAIRDEI